MFRFKCVCSQVQEQLQSLCQFGNNARSADIEGGTSLDWAELRVSHPDPRLREWRV